MRSDHRSGATGYVLKMYPRFSETFVVSEILAREAAGEDIVIFSLRPPVDPRFHPELSRVRAPVVYLPRPTRPAGTWELMRTAVSTPDVDVAGHVAELAAADPDDAAQALALAHAVVEHGVTHLHAHFASVATSVARLAGRLTGVPYSFTAHAKDIFHEDVDPADLERKLREAHHAVTVSDFNLDHLTTRFPAATERLHRVYNGLELDRFPFVERAPRDRAARLCAVGRLVEKKGFDLLLEATARLREGGLDVVVDIAGGGPLLDDLQEQRDRLGLSDAVTFLGPLPQHDVTELLATADVFVAPCVVGADGNADGLPTVLLEAMAAGVPVVASDVTGIPEVVLDHVTGLLIRQGDTTQLTDALATILADGFDTRSMTRAARELVTREFDSTRQARTLQALTRDDVGAARQDVGQRGAA